MKHSYYNSINGFINDFSGETGKQEFVETLSSSFKKLTREVVNYNQKNAWSGLFEPVMNLFKQLKEKGLGEISCLFEYFLPFSDERIDLILLGKNIENKPLALIIELKGWQDIDVINDFTVKVDNEIHQHPELQLLNYLGKLKFSHSSSSDFIFEGALWFYNLNHEKGIKTNVKTYYLNDDVSGIANLFSGPLEETYLSKFIEGQYIQTTKLFETIKNNLPKLKESAVQALCSDGFAPSENQSKIISEILESFNSHSKKAFFIQGEPGSGKTYLAILLLFEIIKQFGDRQQNLVVLGYRNNRLLNTMRSILQKNKAGLDTVIKFYSTGRNNGLAEGNPENPHFKFVIYDEAQRMTKENINIALQRGDITIFFYDENQILNPEEEGWRDNFINQAKELEISFEERILTGIHRVRGGKEYHNFVDDLLKGNINPEMNFTNYDFKVFNDIEEMLDALRERSKDRKIALVASFTESPGDRDNPAKKSIENLRVGYPLYSGFEHYKNKNLKIYWLMDPKTQYPRFWAECQSNELTSCASIYGCQGCEADFIGVIWRRDFIWKKAKEQCVFGNHCDANIGRPSLKSLIRHARQTNNSNLAKRLLINRSRIFLPLGLLEQ